MHADPGAVAGDDAAGLLAPVLEGVEAEKGDAGRVRVPVNAEDAAVFAGFVVLLDDKVFGFRFSVFGLIHSSSPHAEAEMRVIISSFCVRLQVKRYKKSVKNFEQSVIYRILLRNFPPTPAVATVQLAGAPSCTAGAPLGCDEIRPIVTWFAERSAY